MLGNENMTVITENLTFLFCMDIKSLNKATTTKKNQNFNNNSVLYFY